jgi:hypothetical protein
VEEKDTPAPAIEEKDPMVEDTPAEEGAGNNDKEGQGSAMSEVGLSESDPEAPGPQEDEAAPEEPPQPAPLTYTTAADFGFTTENTARFMGLLCLADVEFFVPVLMLNLHIVGGGHCCCNILLVRSGLRKEVPGIRF